MKKEKDKMKLIRGNFLGFLIIGIIVICVGIGFLSSDGGSAWGIGWSSSVNKQKKEDQKTGVICMVVGIGIMIAGGFYYDHAKANYKRDKEIISTIKEAGRSENSTEKLKQLTEMYNSKMITEEEFEKKKKDILDKM